MAKKQGPKVLVNRQAIEGSNVVLLIDRDQDEFGTRYIYRLQLLRNKEELVHDITVENPQTPQQLVRAVAHTLAKDAHIVWCDDQRPYRWNGAFWQQCWLEVKGWATKVSDAIDAPLGEDVKSRGSVLQAIYQSWCAERLSDLTKAQARELRELTPYGFGPGLPFLDGQLIRRGGAWAVVPSKQEYRNLHCIQLRAGDALEALARWKAGEGKAVYDGPVPVSGLLDHFLTTSFRPDQADLYRQWLALHCFQHTSDELADQEHFVVMIGSGGNGKRPAARLIQGVVGEEGTYQLRLDDLNAQTIEGIYGKVAVIGSESEGKMPLQLVKTVVSKEDQLVNPKFRDPYIVRVYALYTQTLNVLKGISEDSDAIAERLIVVHMGGKFRRGNAAKVEELDKKIMASEYHWLIAAMLEGAEKLIDAGGLVISEQIQQESNDAARAGDQVTELAGELEFGRYAVSLPEFTNWYKSWAAEEGRNPYNVDNIVAKLRSHAARHKLGGGVVVERLGRRAGYYSVSPVSGLSLPARVPLIYGLRIVAGAIPLGMPWGAASNKGCGLNKPEQEELPISEEAGPEATGEAISAGVGHGGEPVTVEEEAIAGEAGHEDDGELDF